MGTTGIRILLMTEEQMAAFLGVSRKTVRNWAEKEIIGKYQPGGVGYSVRYYIKEPIA